MRKDDRDTGKQTGLYDTDKIRQRVQRWQADSSGAAVAKDGRNLITVEYGNDADETKPAKKPNKSSSDKPRIETDKKSRQPSPTKSPKAPRELDADRQAWVRKKSTHRNDLNTEVKHAGAPLKRVVSDAHWRKDRSPTKTPENASKLEPRPYTIKRTTIYKSEGSPKSKKDDDGIRVRPMEEDDGIRIIPIDDPPPTQHKPQKKKSDSDRPGSSGTSGQRTPEHQLDSRGAEEPAREKKDRRSAREVSRDNSDRRRRLRRRHVSPVASEAETENRSIAQTLDPDDSISTRNAHSRKSRGMSSTVQETKKDRSAGQSRGPEANKMSASNSNTTAKTTYGNRIEAWLGGTPDPFVADESQQHDDGHKEAATSEVRSKRQSDLDGLDKRDTSCVDLLKDDEGSTGHGSSRSSPGEPSSRLREVLETISESRSSSFEDGNSSYATSSEPSTAISYDRKKAVDHRFGRDIARICSSV
ncbi:EBP-domain-containing protein, partial [Aureobasidium melanogenum]